MENSTNQPTAEHAVEMTAYGSLCSLVDVNPFKSPIKLEQYVQPENIANKDMNERLAASLQVLLSLAVERDQTIGRVDKLMLDFYIAQIDDMLSKQMDEILHHPVFQEVESLWRSLKLVVDQTDFSSNTKIELLDTQKEELKDDFDDASDLTQSGLYQQVYAEYDTPGGEPFTAMISPIEFDSSATDIKLLKDISKVASASHSPFIATVGNKFFKKKSIDEFTQIEDIVSYMERADYIRWNAFRETEDARYIGLTLPRFLLRLPFGEDNPVKKFNYEEKALESSKDYLWGAASFAFATNLSSSFKNYGSCVNIRGPESGGKIENLPLHQFDAGRGFQTKIPTEVLIPETRELALADLGFIPLSYYKNSDFACFFSANSTQRPALFSDDKATSNSRINARLPYIFLSSRIAHYLKVLQRENIGSSVSRHEQEESLNHWLSSLITKMNNPGPELAATHPLREGYVKVHDHPENSGHYRVELFAVPHFQIEGMDVKLSLVGQLPAKAS